MEGVDTVKGILNKIYGIKKGALAFKKILPLIEKFPVEKREAQEYFSQEDVVLITYGDSMCSDGEAPLKTFYRFAAKYFKEVFSTIHILPFFPYSSDDGFSVIDFYCVDPKLGGWEDIKSLGNDFQLMFDLVLNHVSSKSKWFEKYLNEEQGFEDFAIETDPSIDLSGITRPRSLPLLTEFIKSSGRAVNVWTTFSADQIDLNFKSIDVLAKMVEVLLFYVKHGATILRLDAIAYLWKEIGTNCVHLSRTHDVVKLFRSILDCVAPDVMIITETNVPHLENISYLGDGRNEAQMVYNFTLPPLLFYSFAIEDSTALSSWAKGLYLKSETNTFFNFTASHDGIGVRPLEGILPEKEIDRLVKIVKENGGRVSCKRNSDGSESPYELNITYVDAFLKNKKALDTCHADRFLATQATQFVLPGVPAVYIHSILGSHNWEEGVKQTGRARTINRKKIKLDNILQQLKDTETFCHKIFFSYIELIKIRKKQPAFHPNAFFEILEIDPKVFAIKRCCKSQTIYALTNISSEHISVSLSGDQVLDRMKDLLTGEQFNTKSFVLNPYQFVWLSNTNR
ncbi:MAG: sugar phosphorylase [Deltaproteobacteria bacterium]|nr:sugar phosphorylase [Deltaproteobacteria bacterium]MBW2662841.1 sugar phosphorylase [Deltaproteobacteria bacterium]